LVEHAIDQNGRNKKKRNAIMLQMLPSMAAIENLAHITGAIHTTTITARLHTEAGRNGII
jgi:hypothetical protein